MLHGARDCALPATVAATPLPLAPSLVNLLTEMHVSVTSSVHQPVLLAWPPSAGVAKSFRQHAWRYMIIARSVAVYGVSAQEVCEMRYFGICLASGWRR